MIQAIKYVPAIFTSAIIIWFCVAATTPSKTHEEYYLTVNSSQSSYVIVNAYLKSGWKVKILSSQSVAVAANKYEPELSSFIDRKGDILIVFERDIIK